MKIPADYPVQPRAKSLCKDPATCGTCHLTWDDAIVTSMTPAPSARCPFEQFHKPPKPVKVRRPVYLWRNQYGDIVFASTVAELRRKQGGGKVSKMYVDTDDGRTLHVGYTIGNNWWDKYQPVEIEEARR